MGLGLESCVFVGVCVCARLPPGLIDVRVWVKRETLSLGTVANEDN